MNDIIPVTVANMTQTLNTDLCILILVLCLFLSENAPEIVALAAWVS